MGQDGQRMKELTTAKRTYKDIQVFDSTHEALAAGFHMLYSDEQAGVTIYGRPIDEAYPKVLIPAAVLDSVKEKSDFINSFPRMKSGRNR